MSFTLKQLRYFLSAAEHRNVTAAAAAINVSQPTVSGAIAQLEAYFGHSLFVRRKGHGVVPTALGRSLVSRVRRVLAEADGIAGLAAGSGEIAGEIAVGCFENLAPYYLPSLLKKLRRRHPAVRVRIREAGFEALETLLRDGGLDLALTYDLALPEGVERTVLQELKPYAMLPADHPLAKGAEVRLAALAREPLILTRQPYSWQNIVEIFRLHGHAPRISERVDSFELQRGLVANGQGVAVAYSRSAVDRSHDGAPLVCLAIADDIPPQRVLLACPANAPLSRAARAFRDVVLEHFGVPRP